MYVLRHNPSVVTAIGVEVVVYYGIVEVVVVVVVVVVVSDAITSCWLCVCVCVFVCMCGKSSRMVHFALKYGKTIEACPYVSILMPGLI